MTPMQILWCIMYHTRGNPAADLGAEHFNSRAGRDVLDWLVTEGLIVWSHDEQRHIPQERLAVFVSHLCAQPLPEQKWVMLA